MMDLLEKVTKGLVVCREMNNPPGWRYTDCVECPYHENGCAKKLKEDAIELLKEQQEVREHLSKGIGRLNKLLDKKNAEITRLKEQEAMNVDSFMQWCIDNHIVGDATIRGIKYWVGKFKEGR